MQIIDLVLNAIDFLGGKKELTEHLDVERHTINRWISGSQMPLQKHIDAMKKVVMG